MSEHWMGYMPPRSGASTPVAPTPDAIRSLRLERGETQAEFGRAVGLSGDDESVQVTVSRWENGHRVPGLWYRRMIWRLSNP